MLNLDRTIVADRKCEEKAFSAKIFKTLEALFLLYKPSAILRELTVEDIFVKPNSKAFLHVMHYLFTILDLVEFKKRFYWPAYDKNSEALFRNSSQQYLNYLNETHNLGWGEITNFVLLKPGGMKFMSVLGHLIDFVVSEESKKARANIGEVLPSNIKFTGEMLSKMSDQHKIFISKAHQRKLAIEQQENELQKKVENLQLGFMKLSKLTGIPISLLEDDCFIQNFRSHNNELFKEKIESKINATVSVEAHIEKFENLLEKIQIESPEFPCDKKMLQSSYKEIQKLHPEECQHDILYNENQIHVESLLNAFNCVVPSIESKFISSPLVTPDVLEFELKEMNKLKEDVLQLEEAVLRFESSLSADKNMQEAALELHKSREKRFHIELLNTPPIHFRNQIEGPAKLRLPLFDNIDGTDKSLSLSNHTIVSMPKSAKKCDISGFENQLRIIDPVVLMNSIKKKKCLSNPRTPREKSSYLGRNSMFNDDFLSPESPSQTIICTRKQTQNMFLKSPLSFEKIENETLQFSGGPSPCSSKSQKRILTEQIFEGIKVLSPNNTLIYQLKNIVPIRDPGDSNVLNTLNSSPSGRLDSLVKLNEKITPKILLNGSDSIFDSSTDVFSEENTIIDKNEELEVNSETTIGRYPVSSRTCDKENDFNSSNFCKEFLEKLNFNNETESVFNVSDTILKDADL